MTRRCYSFFGCQGGLVDRFMSYDVHHRNGRLAGTEGESLYIYLLNGNGYIKGIIELLT